MCLRNLGFIAVLFKDRFTCMNIATIIILSLIKSKGRMDYLCITFSFDFLIVGSKRCYLHGAVKGRNDYINAVSVAVSRLRDDVTMVHMYMFVSDNAKGLRGLRC